MTSKFQISSFDDEMPDPPNLPVPPDLDEKNVKGAGDDKEKKAGNGHKLIRISPDLPNRQKDHAQRQDNQNKI